MTAIRSPNDLVTLLKGRRLELGESQAQFAARIRKTQSWVSDLERCATPNIYIGTMLEVLALAGFEIDVSSRERRNEDRPDEEDDADLALDFPDEHDGNGGFAP